MEGLDQNNRPKSYTTECCHCSTPAKAPSRPACPQRPLRRCLTWKLPTMVRPAAQTQPVASPRVLRREGPRRSRRWA